MNEKFFSIDIRRSYEYTFERQSKNLEIEYCETHTYTFQTDEGYRYVLLVDEFEDINLLGLKFHRVEDYEKKLKYNVLTQHKNPFRFFRQSFVFSKKQLLQSFPIILLLLLENLLLKKWKQPKNGIKTHITIQKDSDFIKCY